MPMSATYHSVGFVELMIGKLGKNFFCCQLATSPSKRNKLLCVSRCEICKYKPISLACSPLVAKELFAICHQTISGQTKLLGIRAL